jgi:hypothetical protein
MEAVFRPPHVWADENDDEAHRMRRVIGLGLMPTKRVRSRMRPVHWWFIGIVLLSATPLLALLFLAK